MKKIWKMSSKPVREATKVTPSTIISTPAIAPTSVERVSRRTSRTTMRIISVPHTADMNRQPQAS